VHQASGYVQPPRVMFPKVIQEYPVCIRICILYKHVPVETGLHRSFFSPFCRHTHIEINICKFIKLHIHIHRYVYIYVCIYFSTHCKSANLQQNNALRNYCNRLTLQICRADTDGLLGPLNIEILPWNLCAMLDVEPGLLLDEPATSIFGFI
jgi:hypothetical protein